MKKPRYFEHCFTYVFQGWNNCFQFEGMIFLNCAGDLELIMSISSGWFCAVQWYNSVTRCFVMKWVNAFYMIEPMFTPHTSSSVKQAYRDTLTDFRNTVLPRTFTRNFQENPQPEVMRNCISTINDRMDTLKTTSSELGERLRDLVNKHEQYNSAVDGFNGWCGDAEKKLGVLEKEPVGTEPVSIMKQIDRVKVRTSFWIFSCMYVHIVYGCLVMKQCMVLVQ